MIASRTESYPKLGDGVDASPQDRPKTRPCVLRTMPYTPALDRVGTMLPVRGHSSPGTGRSARLRRGARGVGAGRVVSAESLLFSTARGGGLTAPRDPRPGKDADPRESPSDHIFSVRPDPPPAEVRHEVDLDCAPGRSSEWLNRPPDRPARGLVALIVAARGPRTALGAQRRRPRRSRRAGGADDLGDDHRLPERHDRVPGQPAGHRRDAAPVRRVSLGRRPVRRERLGGQHGHAGPPRLVSGQAPTLDQAGQPATAVGTHTLTIALPGGLPPFPEKPYVLVVADPARASATTEPQQSASFRVYTIGIVTHGGIQDPSWTHGPPWELEIAYMMKQEGFDSVIHYNWALQSSTPGSAIKQSPRLARIILATANRYPANSVIDLELIGHSEGTVVNTYALARLQGEMTPSLKSGFIEDTLLDPHAANNDVVSGKQMGFAGPLSGLAHMVVTNYQGEAKDPPPYFPSIVNQANVFFEHTQATAGGIYNLWGQVPVKSEGPAVHYYNLTAMGVTHSGKTGVNYWYRDFIAPTLGDQAPLVQQLQLNGQIDGAQTVTSGSSARAEPRHADPGRLDRSAGVLGHRRARLGGAAPPRPRRQARRDRPGRRDPRRRQRRLVAHHPPPAARRAVSHRRDGVLAGAGHPARPGDRPHPAAGTIGRPVAGSRPSAVLRSRAGSGPPGGRASAYFRAVACFSTSLTISRKSSRPRRAARSGSDWRISALRNPPRTALRRTSIARSPYSLPAELVALGQGLLVVDALRSPAWPRSAGCTATGCTPGCSCCARRARAGPRAGRRRAGTTAGPRPGRPIAAASRPMLLWLLDRSMREIGVLGMLGDQPLEQGPGLLGEGERLGRLARRRCRSLIML